MRGLWKLTVLEIKLSLREPMAAFFTLTFQLMMLFLFGSIYGDKPSLFFGGYGPVDASVPAYTAMSVATSGLLSLAIAVASYREHRMLRRLRATTLHPRAILGAQVIVIFLMRALGMALLFIAGRSVYALRFAGNRLECANSFCSELYELLCPRSSGGWSFAYGTHSSDCRHGFFFYPTIFISGVTIPREILPERIRQLAQVLPLAHVVGLLRGLWMGDPWRQHLGEVGVLSVLLVACVAVSSKTFRW